MNIKSLLLGSAAALVAVTGARAADAVVIADPEPVEYVRVCDVYGTGYFYIPGTETCLRIGGYVRYQFAGGDLWARQAVDHLDGDVNDTWNQYARLSLQTWTGTETEYGTLKTFTETRFTWGNGSESNGFPGTTNGFDGTETTLNFAWIELGGFRVGKDESAYLTFIGYAGNVINDDIIGTGPYDTNIISYTFSASNGFSAIVALESGSDDSFGHDYSIDSYMPHVVAGAKFTQGWGGIAVIGGYDSIHETWAAKVRLDVNINETFSAFLIGGYGDDDEWNYYKPWGGEWVVVGGMTAKLSEKAEVNLQLTYDEAEEFAGALNVSYEVVPGLKITPEVNYYDPGDFAGEDDDGEWGGVLRIQRSF